MARRYEEEEGGFGFGASSSQHGPSDGGVDVAKELQEIGSMNRRFSSLVTKIGTSSDSAGLRKQIRELQSLFSRSVKDAKSAITPMVKSSDSSAKVQGNRYLQLLQKEVGQFEETLRDLRMKEQRHPASEFSDSKAGAGQGDFSFAMDDDGGDDYSRRAAAARREELAAQAQVQESNVSRRQEDHEALRHLETDMQDLHSMFVDMAALVNDQGEMVNTIEDNVQRAEIKVEVAVESTRQAARLQSKSRRKKICCLIIVAAVLVAAVVAVVVITTT